MKTPRILVFGLGVLLMAAAGSSQGQQSATGEKIEVRSGIKHDELDRLLKKYVNEQGLVNYGAWTKNKADLTALDDYLKQFATQFDNLAKGNDKAASLVNAYNALVLQWILSNYPTESIWALKDSFTARRHEIGGRKVSLNDIEHGTLRPDIGFRPHAVLVCAARSCPPLQRSAYVPERFEEQDDQAYRVWLRRDDLNRFLPNEKVVEISSIFKWFKADFEKAGGVPKVLGRYAPENVQKFVTAGQYKIKYLAYNWGLNDQGAHGHNYSRANLLFDNIFK